MDMAIEKADLGCFLAGEGRMALAEGWSLGF